MTPSRIALMSDDFRTFSLYCLLVCCAAGCARGCQGEAPAAAPAGAPARPVAPADGSPAAIEGHFAIVLPQRLSSDVLPGMPTLPYRRLPGFEPSRQLALVLDRNGLRLLERAVPVAQMSEDAAITELLRWGMTQWATRTGLAANRLVLVLDASLKAEDAGRVRRLAMTANTWRVVALARDGDALVELMLDPPGARPANP